MRNKTTEFLTDAAERIIVMTKVYTRFSSILRSLVIKMGCRIMKRFHAFLSWLGIPKHLFSDYKVFLLLLIMFCIHRKIIID